MSFLTGVSRQPVRTSSIAFLSASSHTSELIIVRATSLKLKSTIS